MNKIAISVAAASLVLVAALALSMASDSDRSSKHSDTDAGGALTLVVDGRALEVEWEDNPSVRTLKALARGVIDIQAERHGGFEQVGSLGSALPRSDSVMTSEPGDIFLYMGDRIALFYGSNEYSYTPLGRIAGMDQTDLENLLDKRSVRITLTVVRS